MLRDPAKDGMLRDPAKDGMLRDPAKDGMLRDRATLRQTCRFPAEPWGNLSYGARAGQVWETCPT